jgi:transposase InsO family protein
LQDDSINIATESPVTFNNRRIPEWIYRQIFTNQEQAQLSIFEWIEGWYNRPRRNPALDYQTIEEPELNEVNLSEIIII